MTESEYILKIRFRERARDIFRQSNQYGFEVLFGESAPRMVRVARVIEDVPDTDVEVEIEAGDSDAHELAAAAIALPSRSSSSTSWRASCSTSTRP